MDYSGVLTEKVASFIRSGTYMLVVLRSSSREPK